MSSVFIPLPENAAHKRARRVGLAAGALLGLLAGWDLALDLLRRPIFLTPRALEQELGVTGLQVAAEVGFWRSDIWSEYATDVARDFLTRVRDQASTAATPVEKALAGALSLAPHNARLWALLAQVRTREGDLPGASAAVAMSALTGPDTADLLVDRVNLWIVLAPQLDDDRELLFRQDVRRALKKATDPASLLARWTEGASAPARTTLERAKAETRS